MNDSVSEDGTGGRVRGTGTPGLFSLFVRLALLPVGAFPKTFFTALAIALLMDTGLPDPAQEPGRAALFLAGSLVPTILLAVMPAGPVGSVLLADVGRPPTSFLALLRAALRGTFLQLLVMLLALFLWALAVGYAGIYAVERFDADFEETAETIETSVHLFGGMTFVVFVAASALTMIDVQFGGPPTLTRSFLLLRRAPLLGILAGLFGFLPGAAAGAAMHGAGLLLGVGPEPLEIAAMTVGLSVGAWTVTAAMFAHYRLLFGPWGADVPDAKPERRAGR
jgi:hypothetical protein